MNNKLLKILLMLGIIAAVANAGDYTGLEDADELMATTENTVGKGISFLAFGFGWLLMLGAPIGAYYLGYKHFKEKDEQDRSGSTNTAMIHGKAMVISLVAIILATMLFTFIFVKQLHVGTTTADAIKKVLKIDKAFG